MIYLLWFAGAFVVGSVTRYIPWHALGELAGAEAVFLAAFLPFAAVLFLVIYGFPWAIRRLAAAMRARDKVPPINPRGYKA